MGAERKPRTRRDGRRSGGGRITARRQADAAPRAARGRAATAPVPVRETRASHSGPQTKPVRRAAAARPATAKNASQAKARAKARKAKAPKVVRTPLRERVIIRLTSIDLRPRTLVAKIPFVVLVIGSLGVGLALTLWLSTDAAERSYQLGGIREQNRALLQQKEALERDVRNAQSAPALAEAARNLGMIPSNDAAHLVKDPAGNWVVIGSPKPAEGVPPPPLNTKLPDDPPTQQAAPPPPRSVEVPVRVPRPAPGGLPPEAAQRIPDRIPDRVPDRAPPESGPPALPLPVGGLITPGVVDIPRTAAGWPILDLSPASPTPGAELSPDGVAQAPPPAPAPLPDLSAVPPPVPDAPSVPGVDEPAPPTMVTGEEPGR